MKRQAKIRESAERPSRNSHRKSTCEKIIVMSREKTVNIEAFRDGERAIRDDCIAVEEPMEIRLVCGPTAQRAMRSLTVTMRTPGDDEDLAFGFLYTERIIAGIGDVEGIEFSGVDELGRPHGNTCRVFLKQDVSVDFVKLQRNFLSNSSCGVCGKASIESLAQHGCPQVVPELRIDARLICQLPDLLRGSQPAFSNTGGIHAAGLMDETGRVHLVREDIGRHNAVDKLIGAALRSDRLPARSLAMVVSGRAGFEIVQKAIVAGIPLMVAIGAPSSLAVEMAQRYGMALVGFASSRRFNLYCDPHGVIR